MSKERDGGYHGKRKCIQHGYDYSAICPVCGSWWAEQASPEQRRSLIALAKPLIEQIEKMDHA